MGKGLFRAGILGWREAASADGLGWIKGASGAVGGLARPAGPLLGLLLALALLLFSLPARAQFEIYVPGYYGAKDTKALVHNARPGPSGKLDDGNSDVAVMWTHYKAPNNTLYYYFDILRHGLGDERSFQKIGTCRVRKKTDGTVEVQEYPSGTRCGYDSRYQYVVFRDVYVPNYQEFYYVVAEQPESSPDFVLQNLVSFVVAAAFPPAQTRHGNFSEYTNACNACHGLHSSKHRKLLKGPTVTDLCGTCHDGTGSKYDEVRGYVRLGDSWSRRAYAPAGPFGDRLKPSSGVVITSVHNVTRAQDPREADPTNMIPGSARVWQAPGSGWLSEVRSPGDVPMDLGISNDWGSELLCSSCHEPHNRAKNFRILRGAINDRTYIAVRGVSEVDPQGQDLSPDRGQWGGGEVKSPVLTRAMYSRYLGGGNSKLTYYDPVVEDVYFACTDPSCSSLRPDTDDEDGDGNKTETAILAYCQLVNESQADPLPNLLSVSTSPTGYRCRVERRLGGVTSFCTACHRGFMWPESWIGRYGQSFGSTWSSGYADSKMVFGDIPGGQVPGEVAAREALTQKIEEGDLYYSGLWYTVDCQSAGWGVCSGLYEKVTQSSTAWARYPSSGTFQGHGVQVMSTIGPDRGIMKVRITYKDKKTDQIVWVEEEVNLYNPQYHTQEIVFTWTYPQVVDEHGNPIGETDVKVEIFHTGKKDLSSSGYWIGVDALIIVRQSYDYTYSQLSDVPGEHRHAIGLPAVRAWREGKLVDGVLGSDGDICSLRKALGGDPRCSQVGQGRLIDPVVPLEGTEKILESGGQKYVWELTGAAGFQGRGYAQNRVVCLTCHVAHGSGSERIEVAYLNGPLNDTEVYTCSGYDGDGYCGNDPGEALQLGTPLLARRDSVTGYLWNRAGDETRTEDRWQYVCLNDDGDGVCDDPGEIWTVAQDGVPDGTFSSKLWDFSEPVFDRAGRELRRWETAPEFPSPDVIGFSSALARFNPMASVCYRCHSTTPGASLAP